MKTRNITGLMHLSTEQAGPHWKRTADSLFSPETDGPVAFCADIRRGSDGTLQGTGSPVNAGSLKGVYLGTDTRDGVRNIFTVEPDNSVILAGRLDQDGNYSPAGKKICVCPSAPVSAASAGSFYILLLADGSLYYLMYEWDLFEYTVLGALPSLPEITVEGTGAETVRGTVGAVKFGTAVSDLRSGLPPRDATAVGKAVSDAMKEIMAECAARRKYLAPPAVKIGLRLWDGSLMMLSAPAVCNRAYPQPERVAITPSGGSGGYTGTEAAYAEMTAYSLRVRAQDSVPGKWKSVIRAIEIYATRQQPVMSDAIPSVSFSTATGYLHAHLPLRGEAVHSAERMSAPYYLAATAEPGAIDLTIYEPEPTSPLTEADISASGSADRIDAITGHDAFIHAAGDDTVYTFSYGNPMVVASSTRCGARIRHIAAQPRCGGAYTRQYLYLFTSAGIMALTHDREGHHTNCRTISRERADGIRSVCATDSGVWCLSGTGTLLLIRDCTVKKILRRLGGAGGLGWDSRRNELWIFPERDSGEEWGGSLVINPGEGEYPAYIRTLSPIDALPEGGVFACLIPHPRYADTMLLAVPDPENGASPTLTASSRWVGETEDPGAGKTRAVFMVSGEDAGIQYSLWGTPRSVPSTMRLARFEQGRRLWGGAGGTGRLPDKPPECLLQKPRLGHITGTGLLTADIRGRIPSFLGIRFADI